MNPQRFVSRPAFPRALVAAVCAASLALFSSAQSESPCTRGAFVSSAGFATNGTYGLPELTLRGAPLLQHPFALAVRGRPSAVGWLVLSIESEPTLLAAFGATLYPRPPLTLVPFSLDAAGLSPSLAVPPVLDGACGLSFVAQAVVADAQAQGGLAFTRAARFGFGVRTHDGLVGPPTTMSGAYNPLFGVVADVDGDQLPDVVVAGTEFPGIGAPQGRGALAIFKGHGDGTFDAARRYVATNQWAGHAAVADLDRDGLPDLVATSVLGPSQGGVAVLLGQGGGSFGPRSLQRAGAGPDEFSLVDLDGDGALDLLAVNVLSSGGFPSGALAVLAGNGDGTFSRPKRYAAGSAPRSLTVGDFDGDGLPDVVVGRSPLGSPLATSIAFFPGRGDGTLGSASTFSAFPGNAHLGRVASADLDGDGALDVVALIFDGPAPGGHVSVLLGNGDGSFQAPRTFPLAGRPTSISIADVNGDTHPDLYLGIDVAAGPDLLTLFFGVGDGTFEEGVSTPNSSPTHSFALADVDGDLVPDLVGVRPLVDQIEVRRNLLIEASPPATGPIAR